MALSAGTGFEVKARNLAAKDRDLMPQHENLDLIGPVASYNEHDELKDQTHSTVSKWQDHGGSMSEQAGLPQSRSSGTVTGFTGGAGSHV